MMFTGFSAGSSQSQSTEGVLPQQVFGSGVSDSFLSVCLFIQMAVSEKDEQIFNHHADSSLTL